MIFRIEAYQSADGGDRIVAVFQMLDSNIYTNGVQKAYGGLPKLALEHMIKCGFTDTAFLGKLGYEKLFVPVVGYVFDSRAQGLVEHYIAWLSLDDNGLQKLVKS